MPRRREIRWAPHQVRSAALDAGEGDPWYFDALDVRALWSQTKGDGAVVALLDSGVEPVPGLDGPGVAWFDHRGAAALAEDSMDHGTACAGLIRSTNPEAPGVAPAAGLYSVDVSDGGAGIAPDFVEEALAFARGRPEVDVIACSFTLPQASERLCTEIRLAHNAGKLVVAAAAHDLASPSAFPERTPEALVVQASGRDGAPLTGSLDEPWIDLFAPGEDLLALRRSGAVTGSFGLSSGAAALAAGIAALMFSLARRRRRQRELGLALEGLCKCSARERRLSPLALRDVVKEVVGS